MESLPRKEANDKLESVKKLRGFSKKRFNKSVQTRVSSAPAPSSRYAYNKSSVAPSSLYHRLVINK